MNRFARVLALALAVAAPTFATLAAPDASAQAAAAYALDGAHTSVSFSVKHLGVSNVAGNFGSISGTASYDGKDTKSVTVDVKIDVASISTNQGKRDEHLKSPDFFDAAKYPAITFKSRSATSAQGGKFKVTGDLTIKGTTKEVTIELDGPSAEAKDPYGKTHVAAHGTLKINRKDYHLGDGIPSMVVGEDVAIALEIELLK